MYADRNHHGHNCGTSAIRPVNRKRPFRQITAPALLIAAALAADSARGQCEPPVITRQAVPQTVAPGQGASFLFEYTGSASSSSSFTWFRNGAPLQDPDRNADSGGGVAWLDLYNVRESSAGDYQLQIATPCGTVLSDPVTLTVTPCAFAWDGSFGSPDVDIDQGSALGVHDDGDGPGVYAAIYNYRYGGIRHIARWRSSDGWHPFEGDFLSPPRCMTSFDWNGTRVLVVGGIGLLFRAPNMNTLAAWDGERWQSLGQNADSRVNALCTFDTPTGQVLYAGGNFTSIGGVSARLVARFDGHNWSALGGGPGNEVRALAIFDDGTGPALYAGGAFTSADGASANRIARWNGTSWTPLGDGLNGAVECLRVVQEPAGPRLFAGGDFTTAGGSPARRVARWDGGAWSAVGDGFGATVKRLAVHDDGNGPALHAAGLFGNDLVDGRRIGPVARWDGQRWTGLLSSVATSTATISDLVTFPIDGEPALAAIGRFDSAYPKEARLWRSGVWRTTDQWLAEGPHFVDLEVYGGALHACGYFRFSNLTSDVHRAATLSGTTWSPIPMSEKLSDVFAMTEFDDGAGPQLYIAGSRINAAPFSGAVLTRWNGAQLSAVPNSLNLEYLSLLAAFDGGGAALYGAGSDFVVRWDGATWSRLTQDVDRFIDTMTAYDDGTGPALYVAGSITAIDGVPVQKIARWKDGVWSALPPLPSGSPILYLTMAVVDEAAGPRLYVSGGDSGGQGFIARWDGVGWSEIPFGSGTVAYALAGYDDGRGPALHAMGIIYLLDGQYMRHIARWDGSSWSSLGMGIDWVYSNSYNHPPWPLMLQSVTDENGDYLYAAGDFSGAGGNPSRHIARWGPNTPLLARHPADTLVAESQHAEFSVAVRTPTPVAYQWHRDMQPLADDGRIRGARSARLTIRPVEIGDAGGYHCVVENGCTNADSRPAMLTVYRRGDQNGDALVDAADFTLFAACLNGGLGGPGGAAGSGGPGGNGGAAAGDPADACRLSDLDDNGVVDCADWAIFRSLWNPPRRILLPPCGAQAIPELFPR